jgi:prolyl oligopeptidase
LRRSSGFSHRPWHKNGSAPAKPPAAPLRPVTDGYFGIEIKDPYRYLENLDDPEVKTWLKTQSDYTRAVLTNLPGRTAQSRCVYQRFGVVQPAIVVG